MSESSRNKTIKLQADKVKQNLSMCATEGNIPTAQDVIICGDSFSILKKLNNSSYDVVIADPPYNLAKSYSGTSFAKMKANEYEGYTREWLSLCAPLLKEGGTVYVCCDWESSLTVGKVLGEFFTVRNRITWQREKGRGAKRNWKNCMEDIWFATKGDGYTFNIDAVKLRRRVLAPYRDSGEPKDWREDESGKYRDTYPSNFWDDITIPFWSMPENTAHPTQKPEKLLAKLILASSNEGDIILDPFCGSGSACVTAKKLGRHYTGIEREEYYCALAVERLMLADSDKRIQGYDGEVFKERNYK